MRALLTAAAFAAALVACGFAIDTKPATDAVERFHALLDTGRFEEVYTEAAEAMHRSIPRDEFVALLAAIHRKLGNVKSAQPQRVGVRYSSDGRFADLTYRTDFAEGQATESFVYLMEGQTATLVSYGIDSPTLILK